jgi:hypothetical protein
MKSKADQRTPLARNDGQDKAFSTVDRRCDFHYSIEYKQKNFFSGGVGENDCAF